MSQKPGRFELATDGTLFLDEVGEIPLELQPKLLRVLQEMEFERLGSTKTIKADVRVVAATNRDLKEMVRLGTFREDLYYRLHVFPLTLPSLRERREDIPLLVRYLVQRYSRKLGRSVTRIPEQAMQAMQTYDWPGNVRELENFVERAIILSTGSTLRPPLMELGVPGRGPGESGALTMEEGERRLILDALEACGWVIGGKRGAAARLAMKRTTLQSRMQKLGIRRPAAL
ncbi:MAG: sigma 54-interacting transcriptional regulator [Bryobacterales bacterium]|nr:sigma 54-interacting transcriptional regulator [Bryobacterales bacterium]